MDDHVAQRVHDDLLALYSDKVSKDASKLGAFLQTLQLFRPLLLGFERKQRWWNLVLKKIFDELGHKRLETGFAIAFIVGIFDFDMDEDRDGGRKREATQFLKLLVHLYLKWAKAGTSEHEDYSVESEHLASQLEDVLISIGKKRPRILMSALDATLVDKTKRIASLSLLSSFIRHQPPHLYRVTDTSLIEHLLQCLMVDTCTSAIQISLTVLIMFLPHIPKSILTHLPRLFLIYSRLLCWDQTIAAERAHWHDAANETSGQEESPQERVSAADGPWEKLESSCHQEEPPALDLTSYFTFLYGLYPINFLNYIRKPRRYLKDLHFPRAEELELDQDLIKNRTEIFRRSHLLHSDFFNKTAEEELNDEKWLRSDAADVVAECTSLRLTLHPGLESPGPPPSARLPAIPPSQTRTQDIPTQNLSGSGDDDSSLMADNTSWNLFPQPPSTSKTGSGHVKQSLPNIDQAAASKPHMAVRPKADSTPSSANSPAVQSRREPGDSPTLPPSSAHPSTASFPSSEDPSASVANKSPRELSQSFLKRQLAVLKNEVNFERYLKQQHQAHIAQLQRRHVHDATVSANTEGLLNTTKSLKAKLTKANDSYTALKKETSTGRTQAKKFETELSARVRSLREAERQWTVEEESLRVEIAKLKRDCDSLRQLVVESESRELLSKQQVASMGLELEQVKTLQDRIKDLEGKLKSLEAREIEFTRAVDEKEDLHGQLASAKLEMKSQENIHGQFRASAERHIADLQVRLGESESGRRSSSSQQAVENAIAAANNRYNALKKDYSQLKHQHVELEMRCRELEAETGNSFGLQDSPRKESAQRPFSFDSDEQPHSGYASSGSWHGSARGVPTSVPPTPGSARSRRIVSGETVGSQGQASPVRSLSSLPPLTPQTPKRPDRRSSKASAVSTAPSEASSRMYSHQKSAFSMESLDEDTGSDKAKTTAADGGSRIFGRGECRIPKTAADRSGR